jgi:electron transfer flavoprotein beta subunit
MNIVVLVKQTPDTAELPAISPDEVATGRINATRVINPWDEYAVEEALLLGERFDADAAALCVGDADATDVLKHALAMGVGAATRIELDDPLQADEWTVAAALAAAVRAQGEVDLVLTGKQSVDGTAGLVPLGVARTLGLPYLGNVVKILDIADGRIRVERMVDGARETVAVPLPAVVSVTKEINDPRYPSFMGIRKANKATIPVLTAADLGLEATPQSQWTDIRKPASRAATVRLIDGATPAQQAANLVDALLADKVI